MCFPSLYFTGMCCDKLPAQRDKFGTVCGNTRNTLSVSSMVSDALLFITLLVVGILGATSVITMPPAAAYSLLGLASLIFLTSAITCVKCYVEA